MTAIITLANKSDIKSAVVPSISSMLFHKFGIAEFGDAQHIALHGLAIYHTLRAVFETEVAYHDLIALASSGLNEALIRNRDTFHDVHTPEELVNYMVELGFITNEDGLITIQDKWVEINTTTGSLSPMHELVTEENRRISWVKGGKVNPSHTMKKGMEFLQNRAYHVEVPVLEVLHSVIAHYSNQNVTGEYNKLPAILKDELYVFKGSEANRIYDELFSEWKADSRGRFYHASCFGPNPQSGDMARALDSHNVENIVKKGSFEHKHFFLFEMEETTGCKAGVQWNSEDMIRKTAANPVKMLINIIDRVVWNEEHSNPKDKKSVPAKPFMYIRMCFDWVKFEDEGECDSRISFGEDAKCSGTQYLALLAGDESLMEATGLLVDWEGREDGVKAPKDPYVRCLDNIRKRVANSPFQGRVDSILNRSFSKRPYMQVQYSGGVKSLVNNPEFKAALKLVGIEGKELEDFAKLLIKAVNDTLGARITGMMEAIQAAVLAKCEAEGKDWIQYRHIDGFLVRKPDFCDITISEKPFAIRYNQSERIIFGSIKDDKGWIVPSKETDLNTFVRTFIVNFIQGIDALVARTVAVVAQEQGLRGFTSIHDCFRCCLADAGKMHAVIAEAYRRIFIKGNVLAHLEKQVGPLMFQKVQLLNDEILSSPVAYFFTAH